MEDRDFASGQICLAAKPKQRAVGDICMLSCSKRVLSAGLVYCVFALSECACVVGRSERFREKWSVQLSQSQCCFRPSCSTVVAMVLACIGCM